MIFRSFCMLAFAAAGMLFSGAAEAAGCNCGTIRALHQQTRQTVRDENRSASERVGRSIESQTGTLVDALRSHARENSNHQLMQVEAQRRIEDAAQINAANRLRDEFRAEAESGLHDPNPFSCLLVDAAVPGGGLVPAAKSGGDAVTDQVSDWVSGNGETVLLGGSALSKHVADKRQEFAGFGGSARATTDWGLLLDEPSVDFSDPEMAELAGIIVRNGIESAPERAVGAEELLSPLGLDRVAAMEERGSRLLAASETIEMALDIRASTLAGDPVEAYRAMAADSAYDRTVPDKLSELQQLDILTVWNFAPSGERLDALSNAGGMSERAWLYELHRMLSLDARINYLRLEIESREAIVNAMILATLADDG